MRQFPVKGSGRNSYSDDLLRYVDDDGAEYFTVKATGQSGMSQIGLSRFVGVRWTTIAKWVKKVQEADPLCNSLPPCLEAFAGQDLVLKGYSDPEGRNIFMDSFCAAMVKYYASSKQLNEQSKSKVKKTLDLIERLGMRLFIHNKTGWNSSYHPSSSYEENFDLIFEAHRVRLSVREILRLDDYPELRSAISEYGARHSYLCPKLFSGTHDAMNKLLQGLKAKDIRSRNNLARHVSLRDRYDTRPLMDYSALSRLTANQIRYYDKHPVEAVQVAFNLLLPNHVPLPLPIVENVYKADRRLKALAKQRRLRAGIQLSLFSNDSELNIQRT